MMNRTLLVLTFAAALGSGIVGGIFYGFSSFVMQALRRIPPEQGVAAMNSINIVVINASFMLAFVGTVVLGVVLMAGSYVWWGQPAGKLVLVAGLLYVVACFGVTMTFNQPLNLKLAALSPAQAVAFWPQYLETWTMWNHARTVASLLASALFIVALVLTRSP